MTQRLYYTDAYLTHFRARVVARADEGRRVTLDRSAFYPTSGGQPNDVGVLNGVAVADVVDEGEHVVHLLTAPLGGPPGSDEVEGTVDWVRRFDHMQQHTGQHLLSAIFADVFGYETLSVHFGADYATLDLAVDAIPSEQLQEAEQRANAVVTENRSVAVSFEAADSATGLRKASAREGTLRVVTIADLDRSACGGTHVRSTGEIGAVLLRRQEKIRQATRVEFRCGGRAVARARGDYAALARLAQTLSCAVDEVPALVAAQYEQLRAAEHAMRKQGSDLAVYRARERYADATPDASGVRWLVERRPAGRADDSRELALAFSALPKGVYVAAVDDPPSLLVAASPDSGVDAGRVLKAALAAVGGRGGGSPRLAQGTAATREALAAVLASLGAPSDVPNGAQGMANDAPAVRAPVPAPDAARRPS